MHELSLMRSVAELAEVEASRHGALAITRLHLRLGLLAGVDPEALRLAGEVVCSSGLLAGAHLELELIAATAFCGPCQQPFAVVDGLCLCPSCGAVSAQLLQGRELELTSLELRLPDAPAV
jgi:hydrogenase nickel incorporation protein HypA/HybF